MQQSGIIKHNKNWNKSTNPSKKIVHKFDIKNNYRDEDDPWAGILSYTDFVVQIAYFTMLQATPVELEFG